MRFQSSLDQVRLTRNFFSTPDHYQASVKFVRGMMDPNNKTRLDASRAAMQAIQTGEIPQLPETPIMGNHYHSVFSWGPGYRMYPSLIAFLSKVNGAVVTGLVDHYSMKGAEEFSRSCRAFELPYTRGFEIRAWIRESFIVNGADGSQYDLSNMVINSPGNPGEVYIVFHSVGQGLRSEEMFLGGSRFQKSARYLQVADLLNAQLRRIGISAELDGNQLMSSSMYGNVLDKHVTGHLFDVLFDHFSGLGREFDQATDNIVDCVMNMAGKDISASERSKLAQARTIADDQDREYAVFTAVMDIMRTNLLRVGTPGFVMPSPAECPNLSDLSRIAALDGSVLTYPILLRSAGGSEDPYLSSFVDRLSSDYGFSAVSWMPNRNTPEESIAISALAKSHGVKALSGMDVNRYLQRWAEPASADNALIRSALGLVALEQN